MTGFDVVSCAERLKPWIIRTPLVEVEFLTELTGRKVFLKLESLQKTGAFKFRGAMNYMLTASRDEASRGVITASSGNHGLGMSLGGRLMGYKCIVVMPETAQLTKQNRAKQYGATVILHGGCYDDAQEHAKSLAAEQGYVYVPSFNHPAVIEGQGTILSEILCDLPDADTVMAPIGGGGLLAGLLLAKEQLSSTVRIIGVEPYGAACMHASLQANTLTTLQELHTIADGVAVRTPGSLNFDIVRRANPQTLLVSDADILSAQSALLHNAKLIVETAAAVPIAAILQGQFPRDAQNLVCIISGANQTLPKQ